MNIIYRPIQIGIQEPNPKYHLDKYFYIECINHPQFIYILWLQPHPESLVIESFLDHIPQSTKLQYILIPFIMIMKPIKKVQGSSDRYLGQHFSAINCDGIEWCFYDAWV